jgi:heme/copper-type cytochrome/quinol oxidase subunit 2
MNDVDIIQTIAILSALMLFFVFALFLLSASAQALPGEATTEESRRSREGLWLILIAFLFILAILVWRSC